MKTCILVIGLLIFNSCTTNYKLLIDNLEGNYFINKKNYYCEIVINKDGTFAFKESSEITSRCKGTWKYLGGDSVRITCASNTDLLESLSVGNLGGYSEKTRLLRNNKLKYINLVLKKK